MKLTLKVVFWLIIFLITGNVHGQEKEKWNHYIGINLLQIPSTTIDLIYEFSNNPRYTMIVNSGFTINYANSFDVIGFFLSPHYKCGNDGYSMKNQSGGFIKTGVKFNFRTKTETKNYFSLGAFITNSLIYEKAEYENWNIHNSQVENVNHTIFVVGLTVAVSFTLKISKRLYSDIGAQISIPSRNYNDLYGYRNYIPGMGYMETCGNVTVFPLIVLNLKYKLR